MKTMKGIAVWLAGGMLIAATASCGDYSYPGEDAIFNSGSIVLPDEDSEYPVIISVGNTTLGSTPEADVQGRARAALDKGIYIYAFRRDLTADYRLPSASNREMCLIDGSTNQTPSRQGKAARVGSEDSYIVWQEEGTAIFYPNNNLPYDFFGYYLDGVEVTDDDVTRGEKDVKISVTIDGRKDLMSAKAAVTEEQLNTGGLSNDDKGTVMELSFSSYTAAWSIQPILKFSHHLSKLVFELFPAVPDAYKTSIDDIQVTTKTQGVFTVASTTVGNMGVDFSGSTETTALHLLEADGSSIEGKYHPKEFDVGYDNLPVYERGEEDENKVIRGVQVGDCLMLPPGEMYYECQVTMSQTLDDGFKHQFKETLTLTNGNEGFQAGYQYTIKLAIYGLQDIGVQVTPTPWTDGGSVNVDPDDLFNQRD